MATTLSQCSEDTQSLVSEHVVYTRDLLEFTFTAWRRHSDSLLGQTSHIDSEKEDPLKRNTWFDCSKELWYEMTLESKFADSTQTPIRGDPAVSPRFLTRGHSECIGANLREEALFDYECQVLADLLDRVGDGPRFGLQRSHCQIFHDEDVAELPKENNNSMLGGNCSPRPSHTRSAPSEQARADEA
jgi:hypothetical protein